mmetsp:Transcript_17765/g.49209  ORF Transcript_17765/g.49209 Transcript_17765/m.49209 type:complete len:301 (-) Transcript_17765:362-1264(-)
MVLAAVPNHDVPVAVVGVFGIGQVVVVSLADANVVAGRVVVPRIAGAIVGKGLLAKVVDLVGASGCRNQQKGAGGEHGGSGCLQGAVVVVGAAHVFRVCIFPVMMGKAVPAESVVVVVAVAVAVARECTHCVCTCGSIAPCTIVPGNNRNAGFSGLCTGQDSQIGMAALEAKSGPSLGEGSVEVDVDVDVDIDEMAGWFDKRFVAFRFRIRIPDSFTEMRVSVIYCCCCRRLGNFRSRFAFHVYGFGVGFLYRCGGRRVCHRFHRCRRGDDGQGTTERNPFADGFGAWFHGIVLYCIELY